VVYVDDIDIDIKDLKQHLFKHFLTKDLGKLQYFLENEVAQYQAGIAISQRKYALVTRMLDCKHILLEVTKHVTQMSLLSKLS